MWPEPQEKMGLLFLEMGKLEKEQVWEKRQEFFFLPKMFGLRYLLYTPVE